MSDYLEDLWGWLKTAPLPVVLAITIALGGWVYAIAADQKVEHAKAEGVAKQVDRMDDKLDRLLQAVADLSAEQRAARSNPPPSPTPRPSPLPGKEK